MIGTVQEGAHAVLGFLQAGCRGVTLQASKVLAEAPGERLVVEYAYSLGAKQWRSEALVGKFYADDTGRQTFRAMQALAAALTAASAPPLSVPRPVFYDPHRRFLVQERVAGIPYVELVALRDSGNYFALVGKALACLHSQRLAVGSDKGLPEHLAELVRPHPLELAERCPRYRSLVEALLETMIKRERAFRRGVDSTPLHRDFHLRQLFYDEGRAWLVDWDCYAKGDPAFDLAFFLVYLDTHVAKCAPVRDAFLEGYFSLRPAPMLERVPVYEAFNYLRRACRRFRLKDADWPRQVAEMMKRSAQCLARG